MSPETPGNTPPMFSPWAAVLAWLWPGLGHISLGERRRGLLIMAGVLFLFFSGLLIGGLDVVDRQRDHLWFIAQGLCGPIAFVADIANRTLLERIPEDWISDQAWREAFRDREPQVQRQLRSTSLGRVNEIGTLYIALAGLMNAVVILDALNHAGASRGRSSEA